jgi:intracellular sulfur oxidation DsrE/DsrF family protein
MNKMKLFSTLILAGGMSVSSYAFSKDGECTDAVIDRVDNPVLVNVSGGTGYGPDYLGNKTSDVTTCIETQKGVMAAMAWNSSITHKTGNGQQVINTRNLMNDWENSYGMEVDEDYEVLAVAYGKGGRWVLNDAAYMAKYGTVNPGTAQVLSLLSRGAKIYMCQNTMKGNKWIAADLIDGVEMVPAGVTALVDFQSQGYIYLSP